MCLIGRNRETKGGRGHLCCSQWKLRTSRDWCGPDARDGDRFNPEDQQTPADQYRISVILMSFYTSPFIYGRPIKSGLRRLVKKKVEHRLKVQV